MGELLEHEGFEQCQLGACGELEGGESGAVGGEELLFGLEVGDLVVEGEVLVDLEAQVAVVLNLLHSSNWVERLG